MGQTLVIAEKPSVAGDIARALGGFKKDGDFWVSDAMIVGSAVGHLLEIKAPEEYDVKRGRWSFANLPVLPPHFDLQPIKKSIKKFEGLEKKIRSRSVTDIINACDAGREGELIFRYIIQATGTKKPIRRLWLQSMTKASIQKAFTALRSDAEMKPLEAAAQAVFHIIHRSADPLALGVAPAVADAEEDLGVFRRHAQQGRDPHPEHGPGAA